MKDKPTIDKIFKPLEEAEMPNFPNKDAIWKQIEGALEETPRQRRIFIFRPYVAMMASFALLGVLAVIWWNQEKEQKPSVKESVVIRNTVKAVPASTLEEESEVKSEYGDVIISDDEVYAVETFSNNQNREMNYTIAKEKANEYGKEKEQKTKIEVPQPRKLNANEDMAPQKEKENLSIRRKAQPMTEPIKESVELEYERNQDKAVEVSELALTLDENRAAEQDFYFVDGERVSRSEMKKMKNEELKSIQYLSNDEAAQKGYISLYKNKKSNTGEIEKMLYWDKLDIFSLNKSEVESVYRQLLQIETSEMNRKKRKELQSLIEQLGHIKKGEKK